MHWLGIAAFAGAAVVGIRWMLRRTDVLGRPRSFPTFGIAILFLLGCSGMTPWVMRVRLEARLASAAASIAGVPVRVFCQSFGEAFIDTGSEYGYVEFGPNGVPERSTLIKRTQCNDLRSYLRSDKQTPTRSDAVAVHTLTHESIHMSGVTSESETECISVQRDAEMARNLGASLDAARSLSQLYWQVVYPAMPSGYRSDECRPGGVLDLRGPDAPW
jgi:hypothetical protein